jgi:tRNA nucleotidyltransferase (CCA-adding enzyme)
MKINLPTLIIKVIVDLQNAGFEAYVVGGSVRDLLMDRKTYDWDLTTNATPQQILEIFPDGFYDNQFGTVGIAIKDLVKRYDLSLLDLKNINPNQPLEITTFRSEDEYRDRRHPDKVEWGKTLNEDLKRRDFTINAIALKVTRNQISATRSQKPEEKKLTTDNEQLTTLEIIDPFNGQEDIKKKLVRAVGDPHKRFNEDALRMMRAIRIAAELGFCIEPSTLKAITQNWKLLFEISKERIRDELIKILKSDYPKDGIQMLYTTNLLQIILPELIETKGIKQSGHHTTDVWTHSLDSLQNCPSKNPIVRLATLIHDIGKAKTYREKNNKITFYGHEVISERIANKVADRLRLPKKDKEKILILVRQHMFAYQPNMTDAAIRRFIRKVGKENINDMIMLRIADRLGGGSRATSWRLREFQERIGKVSYTPLQVTDLKIDGNDVMKVLKIKPGPKVGEILNKLFKEVLEDASKNNKKYLLKKIKKLYN